MCEPNRGRCWTCRWDWDQKDEKGFAYSECENPEIPEGVEEPEMVGSDASAPPCPWWEERRA